MDRSKEMKNITMALYSEKASKFRGIRQDKCCNKSSIMSYDQYKSYREEFEVSSKLSGGFVRSITSIGGTEQRIGTSMVPILFKNSNIFIDVKFR